MHAFAPTGRLASMADDTNYGSLGALAPNWDEGERNIDTDEIYERFFTWVEDVKGVKPWPHQEEAIMAIHTQESLSGFIASEPLLTETAKGDARFFARIGKESVTVQITSVVRASDTSFNVRWTERRYVNGAAAGLERWTAVVSIVLQPPRTEERLRKNPLGIYVNGLSWSRELDSSEGSKP